MSTFYIPYRATREMVFAAVKERIYNNNNKSGLSMRITMPDRAWGSPGSVIVDKHGTHTLQYHTQDFFVEIKDGKHL